MYLRLPQVLYYNLTFSLLEETVAERVIRLNVTKKEAYYAIVKSAEKGKEDRRFKLSVRAPRAFKVFEELKKEHGAANVALIPPKKVQDQVSAARNAPKVRRKPKDS